ncbi:hypothetical protein BSAF29S_05062 [Bacillus safensis subsp. safensis]
MTAIVPIKAPKERTAIKLVIYCTVISVIENPIVLSMWFRLKSFAFNMCRNMNSIKLAVPKAANAEKKSYNFYSCWCCRSFDERILSYLSLLQEIPSFQILSFSLRYLLLVLVGFERFAKELFEEMAVILLLLFASIGHVLINTCYRSLDFMPISTSDSSPIFFLK